MNRLNTRALSQIPVTLEVMTEKYNFWRHDEVLTGFS